MFKFFKKKKTIHLPEIKKLSDTYDIVFHIGAPKTGSSAIQKYLLENRNKLIQFGFYYPEHGLDENGISGGQSIIGKKLIDGELNEAYAVLETFMKEAKERNCTLVVSAESLFNRPQQLRAITGNYRCKVISFFRDPLESIYSNYNQGIKRHYSTARLETFCKNLLDKPADFYSGEMFNRWVEHFGKENLTVLGYDIEVFKEIPIQSLFLSTIGIQESEQQKHFSFDNKAVNNSYCLAALELKRMLNFVLDQNQVKTNFEIDWFLQGISDRNTENKYQLSGRINSEIFEQLKSKFASSNLEIKKKYLLAINPNFLTEQTKTPVNEINIPRLNLRISEILEELKKQKPNLFQYISEQLNKKLATSCQDYEVLKLAEMFNHDINHIKNSRETWFNSQQLDRMPNFKLVDFYRVIANKCFQHGDLEHAMHLIEKAKELRPEGPAIIKLYEKLKQELDKQ